MGMCNFFTTTCASPLFSSSYNNNTYYYCAHITYILIPHTHSFAAICIPIGTSSALLCNEEVQVLKLKWKYISTPHVDELIACDIMKNCVKNWRMKILYYFFCYHYYHKCEYIKIYAIFLESSYFELSLCLYRWACANYSWYLNRACFMHLFFNLLINITLNTHRQLYQIIWLNEWREIKKLKNCRNEDKLKLCNFFQPRTLYEFPKRAYLEYFLKF